MLAHLTLLQGALLQGHESHFRRKDLIRTTAAAAAASILTEPIAAASAAVPKSVGPTNEVVGVVNGISQKRLGGSGIVVSEVGLGTQRWGSIDYNAPDLATCHTFLDRAILERGVNLIDTAEQYPIPSDNLASPEGYTEQIIGAWLRQDASRRERVVLTSKITGGDNINKRSIIADCEGSLRRLGTDYLDLYLCHWPARYTPQTNWGQSLEFNEKVQALLGPQASFAEVAQAMGSLVKAGKIRGWGLANDNAYGLTASTYAAQALGVAPPCVMQNDFSLLDRRIEENGVSEAASPMQENVGFMAYDVLAGGVLTGKYLGEPAAWDAFTMGKKEAALRRFQEPRGRMDDRGWGQTLYRYRSGPADEATRAYARLAKQSGMSLTELSLRWARQRAAVTTTLIGTSTLAQLTEDLSYFQPSSGFLPRDLLWEIDLVHMKNRLPIFSSTKLQKGDSEGDFGFGEVDEVVP